MPRDAEILAAVTTRAKQLLDDYPTELAIRQRLGQVGGHVQYPALLKPAGPPFTFIPCHAFHRDGCHSGTRRRLWFSSRRRAPLARRRRSRAPTIASSSGRSRSQPVRGHAPAPPVGRATPTEPPCVPPPRSALSTRSMDRLRTLLAGETELLSALTRPQRLAVYRLILKQPPGLPVRGHARGQASDESLLTAVACRGEIRHRRACSRLCWPRRHSSTTARPHRRSSSRPPGRPCAQVPEPAHRFGPNDGPSRVSFLGVDGQREPADGERAAGAMQERWRQRPRPIARRRQHPRPPSRAPRRPWPARPPSARRAGPEHPQRSRVRARAGRRERGQ